MPPIEMSASAIRSSLVPWQATAHPRPTSSHRNNEARTGVASDPAPRGRRRRSRAVRRLHRGPDDGSSEPPFRPCRTRMTGASSLGWSGRLTSNATASSPPFHLASCVHRRRRRRRSRDPQPAPPPIDRSASRTSRRARACPNRRSGRTSSGGGCAGRDLRTLWGTAARRVGVREVPGLGSCVEVSWRHMLKEHN